MTSDMQLENMYVIIFRVCVLSHSIVSDSLHLLDCSLPDSFVHGIS